jgi:RecA-family ATPase
VDTATQTFSGNQNDERQVVDYINILRRIAVAIQGIVILTKHPSLSGRANGSGESGNTAWHNSVRSRLYVRESVADNCTVISGMKSNYSRKLEKIRLKWQRGVFIQDSPEPVRHWLDRED